MSKYVQKSSELRKFEKVERKVDVACKCEDKDGEREFSVLIK